MFTLSNIKNYKIFSFEKMDNFMLVATLKKSVTKKNTNLKKV